MAQDPIVYALPVFFGSIVLEAAIAWRQKRRAYSLADTLTSMNLGTLSQLVAAAAKFFTLGIYVLIYRHAGLQWWPHAGVFAWGGALLIYDLAYYWQHRIDHEVGLFWAAHVVHHSSEFYNLSTALRQSSTKYATDWLFYVPMAVLGVPPAMFVTVALIDLLYQYWVHTELIGRCGPLEWVLVTPSNHRVHHGVNDYCIDRNYGGILILWDRLFGTFADERPGEKIVYGTRKPLRSFNPLWGNLHVYQDILADMRRAPTLRAKIAAWFAPPGGWREGPLEHYDTSRFSHFMPGCPASLQLYALGQFVLASIATSIFMQGGAGLPAGAPVVLALFVTASLICQGGLLQGASWAHAAEAARLLVLAGLGAAVWHVLPAPAGLACVVAAVISLAWLAASGRRAVADTPAAASAGPSGRG